MQTERSSTVRRASMAACAAALAASVGLAASPSARPATALDQVQRYCVTSWRNAGIHPQDWQDCTQEAIARLLERVSQDRLDAAFDDAASPERRELKRAIWRTIQRWRRAPRFSPLDGVQVADGRSSEEAYDIADTMAVALRSLSPRQQQILTLWSEGHSIDEIARQLGMSAPRASDEKYKALRKLQRSLADT